MKKMLIGLVAALLSTLSMAVELNTASAADLDTIKGIGPKMAASILDERQKNGNFKDWGDFTARVKGVGEKNSAKFSQSGLTISGKGLNTAAAAAPTGTATAANAKTATPAARTPATPVPAANVAKATPAAPAAAQASGNKTTPPTSK